MPAIRNYNSRAKEQQWPTTSTRCIGEPHVFPTTIEIPLLFTFLRFFFSSFLLFRFLYFRSHTSCTSRDRTRVSRDEYPIESLLVQIKQIREMFYRLVRPLGGYFGIDLWIKKSSTRSCDKNYRRASNSAFRLFNNNFIYI